MSNWISKKKRVDIYNSHDFKCFYCGKKLNEITATIDHVIPRSCGGKNNIENLVTSCRPCNSSKALKTIDEYRLYISLNKVTTPIIYSQNQVNQIYALGLFRSFGVKKIHKFYFEDK